MTTPVVLVHGIWDSAARLDPLRAGLASRGITRTTAFDLRPNDGSAPIPELASQLDAAVRAALAGAGVERADVVGFSMGALVARWWIQRGGGRELVRRFVSISGPHAGTHAARALPLRGARDMRPDSDLLRDLAGDADPWGDVEVHCLYTPYDLMIVPPRSSVLPGAKTTRAFPVKLHRWMLTDGGVLDAVAHALAPRP